MIDKLDSYKSIIFDCDGVILNSNKVKTQAFFDLAKPWGVEAQNLLTQHHVNNGGISRHKKIAHFLSSILPALSINIDYYTTSSLVFMQISFIKDFVYVMFHQH